MPITSNAKHSKHLADSFNILGHYDYALNALSILSEHMFSKNVHLKAARIDKSRTPFQNLGERLPITQKHPALHFKIKVDNQTSTDKGIALFVTDIPEYSYDMGSMSDTYAPKRYIGVFKEIDGLKDVLAFSNIISAELETKTLSPLSVKIQDKLTFSSIASHKDEGFRYNLNTVLGATNKIMPAPYKQSLVFRNTNNLYLLEDDKMPFLQ